jgi:Na+/H+-dicarboxylate symporter
MALVLLALDMDALIDKEKSALNTTGNSMAATVIDKSEQA